MEKVKITASAQLCASIEMRHRPRLLSFGQHQAEGRGPKVHNASLRLAKLRIRLIGLSEITTGPIEWPKVSKKD